MGFWLSPHVQDHANRPSLIRQVKAPRSLRSLRTETDLRRHAGTRRRSAALGKVAMNELYG